MDTNNEKRFLRYINLSGKDVAPLINNELVNIQLDTHVEQDLKRKLHAVMTIPKIGPAEKYTSEEVGVICEFTMSAMEVLRDNNGFILILTEDIYLSAIAAIQTVSEIADGDMVMFLWEDGKLFTAVSDTNLNLCYNGKPLAPAKEKVIH